MTWGRGGEKAELRSKVFLWLQRETKHLNSLKKFCVLMLTFTVNLKKMVGNSTGVQATFYHHLLQQTHSGKTQQSLTSAGQNNPSSQPQAMERRCDRWNIPHGCSCPSRAVLQMPWLPTWRCQSSTHRWLKWISCTRWPRGRSSGWGFYLPDTKETLTNHI